MIEEIKSIVKTGDIVFMRSNSFLGRTIRKIAKIPYNHVGIVVKNWGVPFINEAIISGIASSPIEYSIKGMDILIRRPVFQIDEKEFSIIANSFLGKKKYDFKGCFWDQLWWNLFGIWKGAKTEEEALERFYCYEYYWYLYKSQFYLEWWKNYPKNTIYEKWAKTIFKS